ncbi:MAG: hypothetical protein R3264_20000 [Anaerolineae bacterium]|nr:hypothetical protein [Anaerolineae bacterium]
MNGEQTVCIPNIGPQERRKRRYTGLAGLAVSVVILAGLILFGVNRWWRLALFFPLWPSMSGVFQAREQT